MTAEHNHPPRCCCSWHSEPDGKGDLAQIRDTCPACTEHGEFAKPIECPQCHIEIGRPHTDFCTLAPGRVWDGVLPPAVTDTGTILVEDPPTYAPQPCGHVRHLLDYDHHCVLPTGHQSEHQHTARCDGGRCVVCEPDGIYP